MSWLPRKGASPNGVGNCLMVKSQIRPEHELMIENSAMKPATLVRMGAFASGLNSTRSSAMPPTKEKAIVITKAHQYGIPHCINCQEMKVENVAISPCAKLR